MSATRKPVRSAADDHRALRRKLIENGYTVAPEERRLPTYEEFAAHLDAVVGPGGWTFDEESICFVIPDVWHTGSGRAFWLYHRDGEWRHAILAPEALQ
jgi:hypothetical protein